MNTMQNVNAMSMNQVQSSLPIGTFHGPPPIGNVTQINTMENVNAMLISQSQSSLPVGLIHGPPPVGNAMQDINATSINRAHLNPACQPSRWHSGMSPGRDELVPLPENVVRYLWMWAELRRKVPIIAVQHNRKAR